MSARRLASRGHNTFDVYVGLKYVGSVWHYHEGWAAFDHNMRMVSGFHETAYQASLVLP